MALFEGWFYVSKEEQQRRNDELADKIFQFGDEAQRPVVVRLLGELYGNTRKFCDQDQLFGFISAKNQYIKAGGAASGITEGNVRAQLKKIGWRDADRIQLMIALLQLDEAAESLEKYPTAAAVRRRAGLA